MLKRIALAGLLGAGLVMAGCAAPAPQAVADEAGFASPQDLLNDIYNQYADKPAGSGIDLGAPGVVDKYFAPELAQKITADSDRAKANNDIPALNGDPFVDSQDWQITDLAIAIGKSAEPDKTMAIVKFKNYAEQREIKLALVKTASGWQIAEIDWGYEKLSSVVAG
nr:DUF3828 domain-containing protein [uncultured Dongia sp.]